MLVVAAYTLFWLSWLNLDAGYWDLFWPQFLQGLSLGLLFVPLTAVTMGRIPRERMGNATSLFNLMRNVGSSVGIAAVTTMLSRRQTFHAERLSAHITAYSPESAARLSELQAYFVSQGADAATALMRAYAALSGTVRQQAALLSFIDAFYLLGIIFAAMLPLLFLMRRPDRAGEGVHAVME